MVTKTTRYYLYNCSSFLNLSFIYRQKTFLSFFILVGIKENEKLWVSVLVRDIVQMGFTKYPRIYSRNKNIFFFTVVGLNDQFLSRIIIWQRYLARPD